MTTKPSVTISERVVYANGSPPALISFGGANFEMRDLKPFHVSAAAPSTNHRLVLIHMSRVCRLHVFSSSNLPTASYQLHTLMSGSMNILASLACMQLVAERMPP